jgi:hypothetical protein
MEEQQRNQHRKQPRPRREFTKEFKRDAVELVHTTGRPIAQIAPRPWHLGLPPWATGCAKTPSTAVRPRG